MKSITKQALIFLAFCSVQANAIILFGLDNSANQDDPDTEVPWDSVGRLSNLDGTTVGGSGIYLGNGYILTANHVGPFASVTFDGSTFYTHDGVPPIQVAAKVDMKVFRLTTIPTVAAVNLYSGNSETTAPATLIGWGIGRNDDSDLTPTVVDWEDDGETTTAAKRWGLNRPAGLTTITNMAETIDFEAIFTVLGSDTGTPAGLGENEAAVTLLDSGGGLFQFLDGQWYLIGLATNVETFGSSTFGNDVAGGGDRNYFARISTYSTQINALIPEPSSLLLTSPALLLLLRRRRCNARH